MRRDDLRQKMEIDHKTAKNAFRSQKSSAKARGIGWELTFQQWLEFWGSDLKNRGVRHNQLQMQRKLDQGPYAVGNIVKGTPGQNRKTFSAVRRNNESLNSKATTEMLCDAMMLAASAPPPDKTSYPGDLKREFKKLKRGRLFGRPLEKDLKKNEFISECLRQYQAKR